MALSPDPLVDHAVAMLGLPDRAVLVLRQLAWHEIDPGASRAVTSEDPHQRAGVGWLALSSIDDDPLDDVVGALRDWGLVQVVGADAADPHLPGDAIVRLTPAGRACIGLAPLPGRVGAGPGEPVTWEVLHGASREALILAATAWSADDRVAASEGPASHLAGRLATRLCAVGRAILDATRVEDARGWDAVGDVLRRTRSARGGRVLLAVDPAPVRGELAAIGARMRWCAPQAETRRDAWLLDRRVTERLLDGDGDGVGDVRRSDVVGVAWHEMAPPVRPRVRVEDVVVGATTRRQLDQALAHARYRTGRTSAPVGERFRGYKLLLAGPPGTGKSMFGEALAAELDTWLMRLDLSSVLSRWFGETERTLGQTFDVAEGLGAVLLLDEAEALLRQRQGKGGGEALATAVAYLLTRLERYQGVLVATSNRIEELDEAFFRRFDDYVVLPIPDAGVRLRLWERALPADADVDRALLARQVAVGGAMITAAALRATGWAVGGGLPLDTPLVLASLARELEKSNRSPRDVLVEPWRERVLALLGDEPA